MEKIKFLMILCNGFCICNYCGKKYSKKGIASHIWRVHTEKGKNHEPGKCYKDGSKIPWNKGLTKETHSSILKGRNNLKEGYDSGRLIPSFIGKTHTKESKEKIKKEALKSDHRRLNGTSIQYITIEGDLLILDSRWEFLLAKSLDKQGIKWIQPKPIIYLGNDNKNHHYFPDFYLPDYNLYLDPKNSFTIKKQKEKLKILKKVLPNLIILDTEEKCKNFKMPD